MRTLVLLLALVIALLLFGLALMSVARTDEPLVSNKRPSTHADEPLVSDQRPSAVVHAFIIVFVRGSGSTWIQALLNDLVEPEAGAFFCANEPPVESLRLLHSAPRLVHANATFVGAKSKIGQLEDVRELLANGSFRGRVVFLHRVDAFAHAVSVCRKKLSPLQNAVAFEEQHLTRNGTVIDAKLFEVQARELDEQRDQLRTLAAIRDIGAFPTLHMGYESFLQQPLDSFRRLVNFLTHGSGHSVSDAALMRALNSTRLPLKNTRAVDTSVVPNLLEVARVAQRFAYLRPWLDEQLVREIETAEQGEKNDTLAHKAERETFYDEKNREEADKFFESCLSPPVSQKKGKPARPQFHCRIIDFLTASRTKAASTAELASYFEQGGLKFPNVAACVHFAGSLASVARYNTSVTEWQLKDHLRLW